MSQLRDDLINLASYGVPPSEDTACRLSVALEAFLEYWSSETLPFIAAGGSELRFLEAPYGRGKTHFLYQLARVARQAGFATSLVRCDPESKPFASIRDTYRAIVSELRFPGGPSREKTNFQDFFLRLSGDQMEALRRTTNIPVGFRNVLTAFAKAAHTYPTSSPLPQGLKKLFLALPEDPVSVPELYRHDRHLPRPLGKLNKRTAMPWLRGLLTMPRCIGLKGIIVLFDETSADFHLGRESPGVRREHFANLRNLVDYLGIGRLPGCGIIYAVAADLLQHAKETLIPLVQRVERINYDHPNPRAIWCNLDELTNPQTSDPTFFLMLGNRLIELGQEAGFPGDRLLAARAFLQQEAQQWAGSINNAGVREFIKSVAAIITE